MIMTHYLMSHWFNVAPQKEMGGGSGLKYALSSIVYLGKRKEKDGDKGRWKYNTL